MSETSLQYWPLTFAPGSTSELTCPPEKKHAYLTQVFLHNTINGTLRYTNFPSNLSLGTVCLRQIFLAQNKRFNFFNLVSSSSIARTATAGKTFRSSSTINLANNLHSFIHSFIQSINHSGHFYSAPSSPQLLRGAPDYSIQHGYILYRSFRAGVEPTTLWLKVIVSTKAPPRPYSIHCTLDQLL